MMEHTALAHEVKDFLKDVQRQHSTFQMDQFITQKHGVTPWGCYRQCLRELDKRWNALRDLYANRQQMELEMDRLRGFDLLSCFSRYRRGSRKVDLAKLEINFESQKRTIEETEREFQRFLEQARVLRKTLGDIRSQAHRDFLELDFWRAVIREKMAAEIMSLGHVTPDTLLMIRHMPRKVRDDLFKVFEKGTHEICRESLIREFIAGPLETPEPTRITQEEMEMLTE